VNDWEKYEAEKTNMVQYLKVAEAELDKPPATTGQELAKKDLTSKKVNQLVNTPSSYQSLDKNSGPFITWPSDDLIFWHC